MDAVYCVLTGLIIPSFDMIEPLHVSIFQFTLARDYDSSDPYHALSSLSVKQTEGVFMGNDDGASQDASTGCHLKQNALLNAGDVG